MQLICAGPWLSASINPLERIVLRADGNLLVTHYESKSGDSTSYFFGHYFEPVKDVKGNPVPDLESAMRDFLYRVNEHVAGNVKLILQQRARLLTMSGMEI